MDLDLVFGLVKKRLGMIILTGLLTGSLSFVVLVATQKSFRSTADILVVQNQNGFSDYYALSKSADYLTSVLIESIYSEKFLEEMRATNIISEEFLPQDKKDRLKKWDKLVQVSKNSNTGILNIEVFGDNQKQALEVSNAILQVLSEKSFLFLGKGQDIDIRTLSGPIVEANPSLNNIFLVMAGGFLVGVLLFLFWIFYQAELGKYKNIFSFDQAEKFLSPEEETERKAQEYWNSRYKNQS